MYIHVIGAGVNPTKHLTQEAIEYLRDSDIVLSLLLKDDNNFLKTLGVNVHQITHLYRNNRKDTDNYYEILKYLKEISRDNKQQLALVVPGHPRLGVTIAQVIKDFFKETKDVQFNILPGISSFATMYNDLGIDPLEKGTVILDVNRLLLYEYHIETALNYFIYHICSIGNSKTNYKNPKQDNQIFLLKEYLLKFYSGSHKIFMVESAWSNLERTSIKESLIDNIELLLEDVNFNSTLFIPGVKKKTLNQAFLNLIQI